MSVDSGLPKTKRLFRYVHVMMTEGGERKAFESILLTESDANQERTRLIVEGLATKDDCYVIVDQKAAAEYQESKK